MNQPIMKPPIKLLSALCALLASCCCFASNVTVSVSTPYGGIVLTNTVTFTLLNQPAVYGGLMAYGPPHAYTYTNGTLTVSNLIGGQWACGVQCLRKLFILNVPVNDSNTWSFTSLINSNTASYQQLASTFIFWPANLTAWAGLNPAQFLPSGFTGTVTNLFSTPGIVTNPVYGIMVSGAGNAAVNGFYAATNSDPYGNIIAGGNSTLSSFYFYQTGSTANFGYGYAVAYESRHAYDSSGHTDEAHFAWVIGYQYLQNYASTTFSPVTDPWYDPSVPTGQTPVGAWPTPTVAYQTNYVAVTNLVSHFNLTTFTNGVCLTNIFQ